jgi:hypothetical protein
MKDGALDELVFCPFALVPVFGTPPEKISGIWLTPLVTLYYYLVDKINRVYYNVVCILEKT